MKKILLAAVCAFLLGLAAANADGGYEIRGRISMNPTELQEGYATLGQDDETIVIMVKPKTPIHAWLISNQNQLLRIRLESIETK